MTIESMVLAANVATASVLFVSGTGKLVSPHALVRAIHDLDGRTGAATPGAVRGLAAVEIVTGTLLLLPATRTVAALLVGALGFTFAAAGVLGLMRRSETACGCFGGSGEGQGRPLGLWNVLAGALLIAVPAVNGAASSTAAGYFLVSALGTATGMVLLSVWIRRRLVRELTRPLRDRS